MNSCLWIGQSLVISYGLLQLQCLRWSHQEESGWETLSPAVSQLPSFILCRLWQRVLVGYLYLFFSSQSLEVHIWQKINGTEQLCVKDVLEVPTNWRLEPVRSDVQATMSDCCVSYLRISRFHLNIYYLAEYTQGCNLTSSVEFHTILKSFRNLLWLMNMWSRDFAWTVAWRYNTFIAFDGLFI